MKYLLILLILVGCASPIKEMAIITDKKVIISPQVYQPCASSLATLKGPSFEDILTNLAENVSIYSDCKTKQDASIILLRKLTNVAPPSK